MTCCQQMTMLRLIALATLLVAFKGGVEADTAPDVTGWANKLEDCGTGWLFMHRACYRFSTDPMSWDEALGSCRLEGGYLLSIGSVSEMNKMRTEIRKLNGRAKWWVGLKHKSGDHYEWLDGGPFSSRVTPWENGEPHREGVNECVELSSQGKMSDQDCATQKFFICERHEITPRPVEYTTPPMITSSTTPPATTTTTLPATTTTTKTVPSISTSTSTSTFSALPTTSTPLASATASIVPVASTPVSIVPVTSTLASIVPVASTLASTVVQVSENEKITDTTNYKLPDSATKVIIPMTYTTLRTTSPETEADETDDDDDVDGGMTDPEVENRKSGGQSNNDNSNRGKPQTEDSKTEKERGKKDEDGLGDKDDDVTQRPEQKEPEVDLFDLYEGCYLLNTRQDRGKPFLYTLGAKKCPQVTASQITWAETSTGIRRREKCKHGDGFAYFHCGGDPICWRGEPDIDDCASPSFKRILEQTSSEPPEPEEAVAIAKELANATKSDEIRAEDVMVTSKVIKSLVTSGVGEKIKNKTEVKNIVTNVVKAGSNLVATNKSRVWTEMTRQDKIRSATSLLVAMETATVAMAEEIDEPTVIITKDENIELELRVLDVSCEAPDKPKEVVYTAKGSDNEFSIPVETLSHLAKGKLAKVVFMTHYTMGDILDDDTDDDVADDSCERGVVDDVTKDDDDDSKVEQKKKASKPAPRLASYVLSASVGGATEPVKLPLPVTFTMMHIRLVPKGYQSLCSFWSISESGLGEWSQEGCRVVRSNANQTTCECDHMTNFAVLMAVQEVEISEIHLSMLRLATIVGCIISCMCLLASWITFTCFTSLQGERNSIHKNLVVCLFVAELLFLGGIDQTQNKLACGLIAGFLHYFFLAAFLWMLLEGVHIVLMLVQVFDASRSRLPYYYAAGYAPPLLIIAISAGLYHQGYGTERYCWLTTERYFIWSFAGPVAAILLVNASILIYAMTMVCRHSEYVFSGKEKNTAGGIRSWIQGALALEVLLGLTWILGYFFINTQTLPIAYVFTVLNSLQGLFIFCFHCLFNKKARKEYRRVMKVTRKPSNATSSGAGTQSASLKHRHDLSHQNSGSHSHA